MNNNGGKMDLEKFERELEEIKDKFNTKNQNKL